MMDKKAWVLAILAIFCLTACATTQSSLKEQPLPNDINIIPPSADLPKGIAAFSGKWVGEWPGGTGVILVVEKINDTGAQVLYSWGENPRAGSKAGYARIGCKVVSDPEPRIIVPQKGWGDNPLYLKMKDLNTLEGDRTFRGFYEESTRRVTINLNRAN